MTMGPKVFKGSRSEAVQGLDPFPQYKQLRATDPVHYDDNLNAWHLFRYQDIHQVLSDATTFSSQRGVDSQELQRPNLLVTDPPRHHQLRSLISQAFTPRSIEQMEERIHTIVNGLLDAVGPTGHMDIITDLAYPLPVIVIAEMLGVPAEERATFKRWSDQIVSLSMDEAISGAQALDSYFKKQITERKDHHQDDLIGRLLQARIDDEPLTEAELINFCALLMVAGNETTTNLIGNAILCLDDHPDAMAQLRADEALLPGAIEETLRFRSPVQRTVRIVTRNTEIGGQHLQAGQGVIGWIGSANRDEAQFPDPDVFDLRRTPNKHLAFGYGIHVCLGAPLARLETKVALALLLRRFSEIRRDRAIPLQPITSFFGLGTQHLPVILKGR